MKKIIVLTFVFILFLSCFGAIGLPDKNFNIQSLKFDEYDMIIITPNNFSQEIQPLVYHKNSIGVITKIVTLDEIYNGNYFPPIGRDNAEQIKYFIKNSLENWNIKYVMFIGGKDNFPVRYSVIQNIFNQDYKWDFLYPKIGPIKSNGFITDLYFADIYDQNNSFCSWDSNNNSIFGEIGLEGAIDEVDLYPDVCIGRLLCKTSSEVQIVVNKIIDYENNTYDKDWFNNLIICGGDTHPNTWEEILLSLAFKNITGLRYRIALEGEYTGDQVAKCMQNFNSKKFYSTGFLGIRSKSLTTRNINNAINEGAGFLLFSMHGSPTRMLTYPPFNKKRSIQLPLSNGYDISEVEKLTNINKLPIAVFSACSNGDFDTESCPIAWEFIKHENGGSIASFALTTEGNIYPTTMCIETLSGHTTMSVFESYIDGIDIIGEIWSESINRYLDDDIAWSISEHLNSDGNSVEWLNYLAIEEWILLGDPSLKIGGYP